MMDLHCDSYWIPCFCPVLWISCNFQSPDQVPSLALSDHRKVRCWCRPSYNPSTGPGQLKGWSTCQFSVVFTTSIAPTNSPPKAMNKWIAQFSSFYTLRVSSLTPITSRPALLCCTDNGQGLLFRMLQLLGDRDSPPVPPPVSDVDEPGVGWREEHLFSSHATTCQMSNGDRWLFSQHPGWANHTSNHRDSSTVPSRLGAVSHFWVLELVRGRFSSLVFCRL